MLKIARNRYFLDKRNKSYLFTYILKKCRSLTFPSGDRSSGIFYMVFLRYEEQADACPRRFPQQEQKFHSKDKKNPGKYRKNHYDLSIKWLKRNDCWNNWWKRLEKYGGVRYYRMSGCIKWKITEIIRYDSYYFRAIMREMVKNNDEKRLEKHVGSCDH